MANLYFSAINKSDLLACSAGSNLAHCTPCLIHLNCGCTLMQSSMVRNQADNPIVQNRCVGNLSENSVYHAVNLAVLNEFYDMTNITIDGQTLLRNKDKLALDDNSKLPIFRDDSIEKYLAADESASYSLKKLARAMENETVIYHSSSEAIIDRYISSRTPLTLWGIDKFTILSSSLMVVISFLIITIVGTLKNRTAIRDLNLRLVGIPSLAILPQARALQVKQEYLLTQRTTPNVSVLDWNQIMLNRIIREDAWQ